MGKDSMKALKALVYKEQPQCLNVYFYLFVCFLIHFIYIKGKMLMEMEKMMWCPMIFPIILSGMMGILLGYFCAFLIYRALEEHTEFYASILESYMYDKGIISDIFGMEKWSINMLKLAFIDYFTMDRGFYIPLLMFLFSSLLARFVTTRSVGAGGVVFVIFFIIITYYFFWISFILFWVFRFRRIYTRKHGIEYPWRKTWIWFAYPGFARNHPDLFNEEDKIEDGQNEKG